MKKIAWIVGCAIGVLLMILSVVLTICSINGRMNEGIGIVGGADWPTFVFYFETQYRWQALIGGLAVIVSVVGLLWKKKNK